MYSISSEMDSNLAYLVKQLKILFVLEIKRRIFVLNFYFTSKLPSSVMSLAEQRFKT